MTKSLLYKKDTDFVRDNQLINYCLGDDDELLIESFVKNNRIDLHFDVRQFYFLMTGIHKKFTVRHTPETFSVGVDNTLIIYEHALSVLDAFGYAGNAFLVKVDNSKQVGILFSETEWATCSPKEAALRLHEAYMASPTPYTEREAPYVSASFVGPYSGYEQIHQAFLDARALNDLIFFGVKGRVLTQEDWNTTRPCDVTAILANVRRLLHIICRDTYAQAARQAAYILHELISPSYSMTNFSTLYTAFEDQLNMLETVYPDLHIERKPFSAFCTLDQYEAYMTAALARVFDTLGPLHRHSPMILMALSFINRNFDSDISLTQLSEYVYTNPSTLSSEFNAELGVSLTEYVAGLRLPHAQHLLKTTSLSVSDIALQCGYSGAKYFREIFKKQTGYTPLQIRENANEKTSCQKEETH